jgi:glutathione S-transferase
VITALSYIGTEVHQTVGALFAPNLPEEVQIHIRNRSATKLTHLDTVLLKDKTYLVRETLSVADIYLYIVLSWSAYLKIDLAPYPNVQAFFDRVHALPGVQAAHAAIATMPTSTTA